MASFSSFDILLEDLIANRLDRLHDNHYAAMMDVNVDSSEAGHTLIVLVAALLALAAGGVDDTRPLLTEKDMASDLLEDYEDDKSGFFRQLRAEIAEVRTAG